MKITDVEAVILRQESIDMVGDGSQDTVVILVHTDEGITGVGEVDSSPYAVKCMIDMPASHMACVGFKEILIGEDPLDIERLWNKMYEKSIYYGRRSVAIHAMSGIDIALWDIAGKKYRTPVSKLLGGTYRTKVRAYCSVLMPDNEKDINALVEKHMPKGYEGIKFGWGAFGQSYEKDIQLVKWARKALGDDRRLLVDIGMLWKDVKGAVKCCKQFEEYNVFWVEEPFSPDFIEGYAKLAKQTSINIAGGEEVTTIHEYIELIENDCIDIVQPDLSRCGGFTVAKKLADIAERKGVSVVPHSFKTGILSAATLQFIAALRDVDALEYCEQDTILRKTLLKEYNVIDKDGNIPIYQKDGLGIELDMDVVNKYRVNL